MIIIPLKTIGITAIIVVVTVLIITLVTIAVRGGGAARGSQATGPCICNVCNVYVMYVCNMYIYIMVYIYIYT